MKELKYLLILYNRKTDEIIERYFPTIKEMNEYATKAEETCNILHKFEIKEVK